ncbi:MAG: gamma-glutamyl-gamma-aminobutyrate hydrolase family protein, partial [Lachnospiraceae bacterium]|nr:gamma-glutamyl-gamma-aminobutyrate hydrolase family protein [Lachnospiraceae bacterium]
MKKKKPIIGVMALWDDEKESMWMLPGYLEGIAAAGGIPIVLPFSEEEEDVERLAKICDGFLFTGGHDVSTKLYDETPLA